MPATATDRSTTWAVPGMSAAAADVVVDDDAAVAGAGAGAGGIDNPRYIR